SSRFSSAAWQRHVKSQPEEQAWGLIDNEQITCPGRPCPTEQARCRLEHRFGLGGSAIPEIPGRAAALFFHRAVLACSPFSRRNVQPSAALCLVEPTAASEAN